MSLVKVIELMAGANSNATNGTSVMEMMEDVDEYLAWNQDPLRYFFCTFTTCSVLMWFGFAGDNLQYYRMNGGLAYAGGATNKTIWAESFSRSGLVLLAYRLAALCACVYYELNEKILPRVTHNEETDMYGIDMSYFLNLHDWVVHAVTLFFALATLGSIQGLCSRTASQDHYIGHSGRCNTLGHWVMAMYTVAFTTSVAFLVLVFAEALVSPQCAPSSSRGDWSTLLDPASRLCYFEPKYMLGYLSTVVLMLIEASLGRLVFPKCYMSQPIFYCSSFFIVSMFNVMVLGGSWPYEWANFLRKQSMLYVNAFMYLVMLVHLGLVKFLKAASNQANPKNLEERVPLFM